MVLRRAKPEDIRLVFDLSNDPVVRAVSFNTSEIEWREHLQWYNTAIMDKNILFLLAFVHGSLVGQVRFEHMFLEMRLRMIDGNIKRGLTRRGYPFCENSVDRREVGHK